MLSIFSFKAQFYFFLSILHTVDNIFLITTVNYICTLILGNSTHDIPSQRGHTVVSIHPPVMNYRKPVISWNLVNIIFKVLPLCVELSTQKSSQELHSFQIHCKILELANEPRQSGLTSSDLSSCVEGFCLQQSVVMSASYASFAYEWSTFAGKCTIGLIGLIGILLYTHQDKLLYIPNPPGFPQKPTDNPIHFKVLATGPSKGKEQ